MADSMSGAARQGAGVRVMTHRPESSSGRTSVGSRSLTVSGDVMRANRNRRRVVRFPPRVPFQREPERGQGGRVMASEKTIDVVFDGVGPDLQFVEVEDMDGKSIRIGEWAGNRLRIPDPRELATLRAEVEKYLRLHEDGAREIATLRAKLAEAEAKNERLRKALLILDRITNGDDAPTGNEPEDICPTVERFEALRQRAEQAEQRVAELTRERDEARAELAKLKGASGSCGLCEQTTRERDEAREEMEQQALALGRGEERELRLLTERDEAREELAKANEALDEKGNALCRTIVTLGKHRDAVVEAARALVVFDNFSGITSRLRPEDMDEFANLMKQLRAALKEVDGG
jgi:hypothetical protein